MLSRWQDRQRIGFPGSGSCLSLLMVLLPGLLLSSRAVAQSADRERYPDRFRQLEEILPTPNDSRTASGAPGPGYWQQRADYTIDVALVEETHEIVGNETIRYHNLSPDRLSYLWLQLDANLFARDSDAVLTSTAPELDKLSFRSFKSLLARLSFDGGMTVQAVKDVQGRPLPHTVVKTMMRIDLPDALPPGESVTFQVAWSYPMNNSKLVRGRTGYEPFEKGGAIYEVAQWFPRLAAYTDATGWQHKQYIGSGEFTLELGDYDVRITVPEDHVVAASGVLQNPHEILTQEQLHRYEAAASAADPVFVVTPEEALQNEEEGATGTRTWHFRAENVRDFAFASSRKFIWDAMGHEVGGQRVLCMSFYPHEGEPLWSRLSTRVVAHTLDVYSRYTFDYPYPVAQSVNGPVGGMEYPMICFNGPRPEEDGTYSQRTKFGLISVIIHEVGHNYFPMIVNSDERQWTWMDEGINSFVQFLAEQEWQEDYPSRRGRPEDIASYMMSDRQVPVMTNSESLLQFGNNGYTKPATALNVLRETVLGRELFDFAFREYARRWMFKRPMPADFFRTMEDASGIDLDWFWRGWFYSTDHTDVAVRDLRVYELDTKNPEIEKPRQKEEKEAIPPTLTMVRNETLTRRMDELTHLKDFYDSYDEMEVTPQDRKEFEKYLESLDDDEKVLLDSKLLFHVVDLENVGGLVMPVILLVTYEDGTSEEIRIPAEIWRRDPRRVSKLIVSEQRIVSIELDPHGETADGNPDNDRYPPEAKKSRFELFKDKKRKNPMQQQLHDEEGKDDEPEAAIPSRGDGSTGSGGRGSE